MPHSARSHRLSIVALLILATLHAAPSKAATLVVTTLDDTSPNGLSATVSAAAPGDVITFASGLTGTIVLASSPLTIASDLEIRGPGAMSLAIRPGSATRALVVEGGKVTISGLTLLPQPGGWAGGIQNGAALTLRNVIIRESVAQASGAQEGGGISNDGDLTLWGCEVSGCIGPEGGGIYSGSGSTLDVMSSTVAEDYGVYGGGIYGDDASIRLVNSTVSSNSADFGGGLYVAGGSLTVTSSTIVGNGNSGQYSGGPGLYLPGSPSVQIRNSVVALNRLSHGGYSDIVGDWTDLGFNLVGSDVDPMLGPLQNAGGLARVKVPLPGSPLIDRGHSSGYPYDELGHLRPYDDATIANGSGSDGSDIGAVEAGAAVISVGPRPGLPSSRIAALWPNPMRSVASVGYVLPRGGSIRLTIVAIDGRKVRQLRNGWRDAGTDVAVWDGTDDRGVRQPAGVYWVRFESEDHMEARRLVLIR